MKQNKQTESILVLGAGELGIEVLHQLAKQAKISHDVTISVLLRATTVNTTDPGKQKEIRDLKNRGVQIVIGDIASSNEAELVALFTPYDTVISCIGFSAGRGTQVNITKAVLSAGVKRYIPWQFGADYDIIGRGSVQDVFDEQLDVRDLLRAQQNTQWLIVATGMFTSFLFEPSFGVVDLEHNIVHALGSWDNQVTVTTPEDIGRLTTAILFHRPRIINKVVFVAGDTISYGELADTLEALLNRPFHREKWRISYLNEILALDPDNVMLKYRSVFAAGIGVAWPKTNTFNAQQAIETTDVPSWIRAHLM